MNAWADLLATASPRPGLLGLELEPFPFISGYGIALRILRLNEFGPSELFSSLGIRMSHDLDVLRACHRPGTTRARFVAACGLNTTCVPDLWSEQSWSPLNLHGAWDSLDLPLRLCPACARFGYHCSLFQLPSITHCPWHHEPLRSHCTQCDKPMFARLSDDRALGRCSCGHDTFDGRSAMISMWTFPAQEAETKLTRYLAWIDEACRSRHLVAAGGHGVWLTGFASLASPPPSLWEGRRGDTDDPCGDVVPKAPAKEPPATAFWGWALLGSQRPLTLAPLPPSTHRKLIRVSRSVVDDLPEGAPTPSDLVTTYGFAANESLQDNVSSRPDAFILPHGETSNGSTWLHLSAVDPLALQLCAQLIATVARDVAVPAADDFDRSLQASQSAAIDRVSGRWRLMQVLERILAAGYAQGLRAVLANAIGLAPASTPTQWRLPVVEVQGGNGRLDNIRVQWVCIQRSAPPRSAVSWVLAVPSNKARAKKRRGRRASPSTRRKIRPP